MLLRLHAVHAGVEGAVTPLTAEAGMLAATSKALRGTVARESTVGAVPPEGLALAAGGKVPAAAAIAKTALSVMTLPINVARRPVEIAIEMPPLARAQSSIGPDGCLFAADATCFTSEATCFAAREIALLHSLLDSVLLRILAFIDAALAFSRRDRQCDGARKQCRQDCARCHALHVFLHFRLMPVAVRHWSAFASGGAPMH